MSQSESINYSTNDNDLKTIMSIYRDHSNADPVEQIWQDKLRMSRSKVSSLLEEFVKREKIKQENIFKINDNICKLHTHQFALQNDNGGIRYAVNPKYHEIENAITGLEKEIRSEYTGCWKDKLALRKDLTDAIDEHLSLIRKLNLLGLKINQHQNG